MKNLRLHVTGILLCQMIFLAVPNEYKEVGGEKVLVEHSWMFPIKSEGAKACYSAYVFWFFAHVSALWILALGIKNVPQFSWILMPFIVFESVDFIDFLVHYNDVYWYWGTFPISWNTLGTAFVLPTIWFTPRT